MKKQIRHSHFLSLWLRAGLIVALLIALPPSAALAYPGTQDVYYVVALDDGEGSFHDYWTADGLCDFSNIYGDDQCSLVAAIEQANARSGQQEIYFRPGLEPGWAPLAGFTNLPNPFYVTANGSSADLPTITGDVIIDGSLAYPGGPGGIMVFDGSSARPIFDVANGATLTLRNMTIRNGANSGDGGCVVASGDVVLENVTVQGCTSGGSQGGGAIYTSGSFSETGSTLQNSQATAGHGGAVYAGTDVTLNGGSFQNNWANGNGGGIFHSDGRSLTVTNSTFSGNRASTGDGGAIYNTGFSSLTVTNSTFSGNRADGDGGAIYNISGPQTVTNSTFSGNTTLSGNGGGIYSQHGPLTVTNSVFSLNSAAVGGGIHCPIGDLTVGNSTFSGNSAALGGGIYKNLGSLTVTNSTFSGNAVNYGGGIYNTGFSSLTVTNSTFSGNRATTGDGGGIFNNSGTASITNTLLANSMGSGNCSGSITDGGGNLQFGGLTADSCGASIPIADPLLDALGNYGGSTQTIPLLPGSPALDAASGCSASDQRGKNRVGNCDSGAFESQGFSFKPGTLTGTPQSAAVGTAFATPLGLTVIANDPVEPVDGGQITFTPPGSGASAVITGSPATISGGAASVTAAANGTAGTYNVRASAAGATAVDFALTNLTVPTVTTGAASGVTGSGATLNGTVNANGVVTTASFEYGPDASYGTTVSASPATLTGSTATAIHADLSGLAPNSTYHFRAVGGTVNGLDATFTTPCVSAITVTNANNSGAGSLRQAIADVCSGGTITFDANYTILLASELAISKNLTITGAGHSVTVSGNRKVRVFNVSAVSVIVDTLTIAGGRADGGGIYNAGSLTVTNSTFSGNSAGGNGGGIYNAGSLMVTNSTFSGNYALGDGGGIYNVGSLTVTNSTFSGNSVTIDDFIRSKGGGIYNAGSLTVTNSTFSGNSATIGGGIYGNVIIKNTLLANNAGGNCYSSSITNGGGNLQFGGQTANSCGSFTTADPRLGALGNYGGSTQTFPLLPGSPAIDAGLSATCIAAPVSSLDQRGVARPAACDIGAFESQGFRLSKTGGDPQSTLVNTAFAASLAVSVTANDPVEPVNGGQITFTPPGSPASAVITGSPATISGGAASVTATANSTAGAYNVTASARGVATGVDFALTNLLAPSVTTGAATAITSTGAILNGTVNANGTSTAVTFQSGLDTSYGSIATAAQSPVTGMTDTVVSTALTGLLPNTTYHFRAVGANAGGTVNGLDATFTTACASAITVTNANDSGAGSLRQAIADVCSGGTIDFAGNYTIPLASELAISKDLTITGAGHSVTVSGQNAVRVFKVSAFLNVTIDTLTIANGGGAFGGGIYSQGYLTVTNSTFSGNIAGSGGGIYNSGRLTVTNSTFSGNSVNTDSGGGIYSLNGPLTVTNSTFSGNYAYVGNGGGIYHSGIFIVTVENSTFSGNYAMYGGGGFFNDGGIATIINTLLANNTGGNCYGGIANGGGNLQFGGTRANSCGASIPTADPLLGALGDYGGSTQTIPLLPGSPAIDAGDSATCVDAAVNSLDQRGVTRPSAPSACDIGAFESQGFNLAKTSGDNQSVLVNTAFAAPLAFSVTANAPLEPVNGGQVAFTPPGSPASAVITGSPATISGNAASVTASANGAVGGPYNVNASARGATSVDFALTNLSVPDLAINDVSAAEGAAGATTFTFTVSLSIPAQPGGVTFDIATADNSATTADSDYVSQSLTGQTIPAGSSSYTFTVTVNGDTLVESDETFFVNITNVSGANVSDDQGQGTISNDDFVPTVTTNPATAISQTGATLNGAVNANGASTTVTIEYWQASNPVTTVSATPSPVTDSTDTAVSYALTGLTPNTTYTYHVIGVSAVGAAQGADVSFTTGAQAPGVTTDPASALTTDSATLNGTVNAQNDSTTVSFEYGLTTSYGASVTAVESPVTGLTNTAVSSALSGLTPNTTYHYRAVGVNSAGTILGSDRTFTTLALSVTITTEIHGASAHSPLTVAALGDSLHALATLAGNGPTVVTGSVAFTSFANPTCAGTGKTLGTQGLVGTVADDPTLSDLLTVNGLSFKAHYLGDANYPAIDGPCVSISASPYPTVLTLSASTVPQDGAVLTASPANLQIQFSLDVLHGSTTNTNSAENPANYLLVAPGANGSFETLSCGPLGTGGLKPDDTQITVNSVSYDPATLIATLAVNNGAALPNGLYQLFICGTTSISDPTGAIFLNNHLADSRIGFVVASAAASSSDPAQTGSGRSKAKKLPATGFALDRVTLLPVQPDEKRYTAEGMWLEIPALGLRQSIVGVPGPDWDVTWLGKKIGYLQGTAYPTWAGNTVLTGHVWDALNQPGPFAQLKTLRYGDQVQIRLGDKLYIYEVRENRSIAPQNVAAALVHEDYAWLTLLTCEDYNALLDTYAARRMVRAVLVSVK